jgi:hypothetical protein
VRLCKPSPMITIHATEPAASLCWCFPWWLCCWFIGTASGSETLTHNKSWYVTWSVRCLQMFFVFNQQKWSWHTELPSVKFHMCVPCNVADTCVREVLTVVSINMRILWNVALSNSVNRYQHFWGTCCLHVLGRRLLLVPIHQLHSAIFRWFVIQKIQSQLLHM